MKQSGVKNRTGSFTEKVYRVVSRIKRGKVMTYGGVARAAGSPRASRAVGNIMHNNPDTKRVPCHRVVRGDRSIGGYAQGSKKKLLLLKREGVRFRGKKVMQESIAP
jgi:O-6-methylguanine DNA methyltransferase